LWAAYRLPEKLVRSGRDAPGDTETLQQRFQHNDGSSQQNDESSQHNDESSQHNDDSSQHNDESSQHNGDSSQHTDPVLDGAELLAIAAPAREKARLAPAKMRELIRHLCQAQSLTVSQIAGLWFVDSQGGSTGD